MQSAAPDTSRQKEATTAFPHSLIQFLSGPVCLSPEHIIIRSSIRFFKDATSSSIRIWFIVCFCLESNKLRQRVCRILDEK